MRAASENEIRLIESVQAEVLRQRGYELSGLRRTEVGSVRRVLLRIDSKWRARRTRIRRYGLALIAAEIVTRRLALAPLHRRVLARIHTIQIATLK